MTGLYISEIPSAEHRERAQTNTNHHAISLHRKSDFFSSFHNDYFSLLSMWCTPGQLLIQAPWRYYHQQQARSTPPPVSGTLGVTGNNLHWLCCSKGPGSMKCVVLCSFPTSQPTTRRISLAARKALRWWFGLPPLKQSFTIQGYARQILFVKTQGFAYLWFTLLLKAFL